MNGFTKTIISVSLGWIKQLFNFIWEFFNSPSNNNFIGFIAKNWLYLVIALSSAGIIIDWIMYVIRWRPQYVWWGKKQNISFEKTNKNHKYLNSFDNSISDNTFNTQNTRQFDIQTSKGHLFDDNSKNKNSLIQYNYDENIYHIDKSYSSMELQNDYQPNNLEQSTNQQADEYLSNDENKNNVNKTIMKKRRRINAF